jgi:ribosome-associated toxin RatA of RatAB toxin-antitoxin module
MGMNWAEHSVEIAAPIQTSFEAIVDYETFPSWQDAVDSVEVLSRTKDGLGEDVRLYVDAKVKKIDYTLRYRYSRPTEIEWDFVTGNGMRDVDGVYTFEELGPDRTRATYKLGADPAIPVPGMVLRRTHKQLVKRSVEDLKREAERRYAAAGAATPPDPAPAPTPAVEEPAIPPAADGPAPKPPAEEWKPKAVREPPASPGSSGRSGASSHGSLAELPGALVGKGLSVAGSAARSGREAAETAAKTGIDIAQDVAARIEKRIGRERD